MVREFNFKKSYEDLTINGNPYKVDFSDEAIMKYQTSFNQFHKRNEELKKLNDNEKEYLEKAQQITKDVIETILGEGTFNGIYEESGKSLYNIAELIEFLAEIIGDKVESVREKNRKKYVRK